MAGSPPETPSRNNQGVKRSADDDDELLGLASEPKRLRGAHQTWPGNVHEDWTENLPKHHEANKRPAYLDELNELAGITPEPKRLPIDNKYKGKPWSASGCIRDDEVGHAEQV